MTFLERTFSEEVIARSHALSMPEMRKLAAYLSDQVAMHDLPARPDDGVLAKWLPGNWHATGWVPPADLQPEAYFQVGEVLGMIEKSRGWWWGDYIHHGNQRYGEMYAQAVDLSGLQYSTLAHYVNVARRFEHERRRGSLSFSHHAAIARDYLTDKEQDDLLQMAIDHNLSVTGIEAERNAIKRDNLILKLQEAGELVDVEPEETAKTEGTEISETSKDSVQVFQVEVLKERDGEVEQFRYVSPAYAVGNPHRPEDGDYQDILVCPHCGVLLAERKEQETAK